MCVEIAHYNYSVPKKCNRSEIVLVNHRIPGSQCGLVGSFTSKVPKRSEKFLPQRDSIGGRQRSRGLFQNANGGRFLRLQKFVNRILIQNFQVEHVEFIESDISLDHPDWSSSSSSQGGTTERC